MTYLKSKLLKKPLVVKIEPVKKEKRSLDSNAYCWVIGQIADILRASKEEGVFQYAEKLWPINGGVGAI